MPSTTLRRALLRLVVLVTAVLASLSLVSVAQAAPPTTLTAGQRLDAGEMLQSANGSYRLVMQRDGNLVVYTSENRPLWASGTGGHAGAYLVMQGDGNAVVYRAGRALWHTHTMRNPGARLVMQSDANLVVYRSNGSAAWASKRGLPLPVATGATTQVITVVASSPTATTAQLTAWVPGPQGWVRALGPITAYVGSGGIGAAGETSTRTPAGTYTLTEAFGRKAAPGTRLPYRGVDHHDWWVSDVDSDLYNQHTRCAAGSCPFDESAGENLFDAGAVYDYAVVIDYNREGTPGAGSAFFLHVTNDRPTAGCVAIARTQLVSLMRWLDPARLPLIVMGVR
jgi:L,D-peptidoglycan transpeptidase YkuD (ErfK/YbiS/YcfS/YnhG family)